MTPLRKKLITLADIIENAKGLARRLSGETSTVDTKQLKNRLIFNLRELENEARDARLDLERELASKPAKE